MYKAQDHLARKLLVKHGIQYFKDSSVKAKKNLNESTDDPLGPIPPAGMDPDHKCKTLLVGV